MDEQKRIEQLEWKIHILEYIISDYINDLESKSDRLEAMIKILVKHSYRGGNQRFNEEVVEAEFLNGFESVNHYYEA